MNLNLKARLFQVCSYLQESLFPYLAEKEIVLSPALKRVLTVLELVEIERFVPSYCGIGRKARDRHALARAFVAKAVLNLPTTESLIDRLKSDDNLKRLCGFSVTHVMPGKHCFSRAFAEFAAQNLAQITHNALIKAHLGDQIVGHVSYDSTAIVAREKGAPYQEPVSPTQKHKRGRPRKGEEREAKPDTRIIRQQKQSLEEMLKEIPKDCDTGTKKNAKGFKESWKGYKAHIATADGDIPIAVVVSAASVHDSQVFMPLLAKVKSSVTALYDLADAAYCSPILRDASKEAGHVPLIDHNPRRGEKIPFAPHEKERYKARSSAERVNAYLKDSHGGNCVRVKTPEKVASHLMFGILSIAAIQLSRLLL